MNTSERLKLMRQRLSLSQAGAAALLNTSLRTYQGWEVGKKPVATEIMIEAMAGYLETKKPPEGTA